VALATPKRIARARHELAKGFGIGKVARMTGLGTGTVHKLKREMGRPIAVLITATRESAEPHKAAANFCIAEVFCFVPRAEQDVD
jgi:hypothetical protein